MGRLLGAVGIGLLSAELRDQIRLVGGGRWRWSSSGWCCAFRAGSLGGLQAA